MKKILIPTIQINNKKLIKIISYTFFAIAALIILWLASLTLYQNRQTISLATSIKPENFTELYFEDNAHLPLKIKQKNTNLFINPADSYSFKFTIHNLENKEMKYHYEVYILDPNKVVFDQGEVNIQNNESKTIDETFYMPSIYPRTKFVVNLIDKNQQIAFWMREKLQ